uniref:Uncharacterized protein n=1 Tax=Oryza punctata TaxID=4537 RepID=A0A0E0LJY5_ORYPU
MPSMSSPGDGASELGIDSSGRGAKVPKAVTEASSPLSEMVAQPSASRADGSGGQNFFVGFCISLFSAVRLMRRGASDDELAARSGADEAEMKETMEMELVLLLQSAECWLWLEGCWRCGCYCKGNG